MCASKIGRMLGVGDGVGEADAVGVGDGEMTSRVAVGDGELAAGRAHAATNTRTASNPRAITL
jgi:hypothetical protein